MAKRVIGVVFGALAYLGFGDSVPVKGQDPVNPQVPDFICKPVNDYERGVCLSMGDGDPQGPLGSRTPVVFVHGLNLKEIAGEPDLTVWSGLGGYFWGSPWFRERFKMYFLVYLSNIQRNTIRELGLSFRFLVWKMDQIDSDFRGKPLIIIGHSMGGLVARSFMKEQDRGSPRFMAERVLRLITLGTPHRGTPFANGPARDVKAGLAVLLLHQFVDGGLFGYDIRSDMDNRWDLHWQNHDGLLDYGSFPENSVWMDWLNSEETFENKLVVYGGKVSPLGQISDCGLGLKPNLCLAALMNQALGISQSDGLVPLQSALFEPCAGCLAKRVFEGYDHSEIARGKDSPFLGPDPLFEDVANFVLGAFRPSPAFDAYADMGNPDDERFHRLSGWDALNPGPLPRPDTDRTSRYQFLRGESSVDLFIAKPYTSHRLTFRAEDGFCDDSFSVLVNGYPVFSYKHGSEPDFPVHSVRIGGEFLPGSRVRIAFRNQARDNCGKAAVYYARLDPM